MLIYQNTKVCPLDLSSQNLIIIKHGAFLYSLVMKLLGNRASRVNIASIVDRYFPKYGNINNLPEYIVSMDVLHFLVLSDCLY